MRTDPLRQFGDAHVPPPDPENYWPFKAGQVEMIGTHLTLRVDDVFKDTVVATEVLNGVEFCGVLAMDDSVVIAKSAREEPLVTVTLRRIEGGVAYLQISAHPSMRAVPVCHA